MIISRASKELKFMFAFWKTSSQILVSAESSENNIDQVYMHCEGRFSLFSRVLMSRVGIN